MQISPIKFYKSNNIKDFPKNKSLIGFSGNHLQSSRSLDTCANLHEAVLKKKILDERLSMLSEIRDYDEYISVLNKISEYIVNNDGFTQNLVTKSGYENAPVELQGLIPYCGDGDLSDVINSWLTARSFHCEEKLSSETISDIIRALEFSLKKLDKRFGKYKGKAYRVGYFNPNQDKQFYSASKDIGCAYEYSNENVPSPKHPYSIIKLKHGHDIHKFQEFVNSVVSKEFARSEKEVLIDRNSSFEKIPFENYTQDDLDDILTIINTSMKMKLLPKNFERFCRNIDILNWISVWEQV